MADEGELELLDDLLRMRRASAALRAWVTAQLDPFRLFGDPDLYEELRPFDAEERRLIMEALLIIVSEGAIVLGRVDAFFAIGDALGFDGAEVAQFVTDQLCYDWETLRAYGVLGLHAKAPVREVKRTYRQLAALYHPDKVLGLAPEFQEMAREKMIELNKARELLAGPDDVELEFVHIDDDVELEWATEELEDQPTEIDLE